MKPNKQALFRGQKFISNAHDASKIATLHAKMAKNCRKESWEDCIILVWMDGNNRGKYLDLIPFTFQL